MKNVSWSRRLHMLFHHFLWQPTSSYYVFAHVTNLFYHCDFKDKSVHGRIAKDKVLYLNQLTDCFLTHDWGTDELGRSNHERVAKVNSSLKERGFVTWFDSEKLVGNILAQMCNGIDRTKCVIVFITKNYVDKVSSENANDNCQLEFSYAVRQKSAKVMIPVVMEGRMRDTSQWRGAVGMALGGSLYIDLVQDHNWDQQMDELGKYILSLVKPIRKTVLSFPWAASLVTNIVSPHAPPPIASPSQQMNSSLADSANTKALAELTPGEVVALLRSLNLSNYMIPFQKKGVDGATLAYVYSEQDIIDLGIDLLPKTRLLFTKVQEFKQSGVPCDLLIQSAAFFPTSPRVDTVLTTDERDVSQHVDTHHAIDLACLSQDATVSGKHQVRYNWVKSSVKLKPGSNKHHIIPYSEKVDPKALVIRRLTVRGVTGALEKRLNGDYCLHELEENDVLHPVYRKACDPDMWLEYLKDKKCWQIKTTASRGTKSCLAELSSAMTKNLFEAHDKHWMVHDGKGSFAEQASVKTLPHIEPVVVFGAQGKVGNKLNGKYLPSAELHGGRPVFVKVGDPDICMEYNSSRSRWQLKTTAGKGSNSCLSESAESSPHSASPADVHSVWLVSIEHKFEPHPSLHIINELQSMKLQGGNSTGKTFNVIQGVYIPYYELSCGQMVYRHQDRADLWLEYSEPRKRWQIKPTKAHNSALYLAELRPEQVDGDFDAQEAEAQTIVPFLGTWELSEDHKIIEATGLHLCPVFEPIFIVFTTLTSLGEHFDDFLRHCSGMYVPIDKAFSRYPIYKHRSPTHLHYIKYHENIQCWQLHSSSQLSPKKTTPDIRQNSGIGELIAIFQLACKTTDPIEACSGSWTILHEELLDSNHASKGKVDARVLPRPCSLHLLDTTGPRTALINGLYDPTDEVYDNMLVYKRREVTNDPDGNDIWIEYCAPMKTWQLKRTGDRGSPKAYATLVATAPQLLQDNAQAEKWSVFDTNKKEWLTQPQLKCLPIIHSLFVLGATGSHAEHINGQFEPVDRTYHDMPLYKKKTANATDTPVWIEYNRNLRSWQVKGEKDRGQNKAWAYLTVSVVLRVEECRGVWEVFDTDLKWQPQPDMHVVAIVS
ncbi:TIR domain-containing protein [archaeon]|nr:MAG: TIR domain-containing protein [archaeon]